MFNKLTTSILIAFCRKFSIGLTILAIIVFKPNHSFAYELITTGVRTHILKPDPFIVATDATIDTSYGIGTFLSYKSLNLMLNYYYYDGTAVEFSGKTKQFEIEYKRLNTQINWIFFRKTNIVSASVGLFYDSISYPASIIVDGYSNGVYIYDLVSVEPVRFNVYGYSLNAIIKHSFSNGLFFNLSLGGKSGFVDRTSHNDFDDTVSDHSYFAFPVAAHIGYEKDYGNWTCGIAVGYEELLEDFRGELWKIENGLTTKLHVGEIGSIKGYVFSVFIRF